eukprot:4146027-Prorocentrum_lima.AAC.1
MRLLGTCCVEGEGRASKRACSIGQGEYNSGPQLSRANEGVARGSLYPSLEKPGSQLRLRPPHR